MFPTEQDAALGMILHSEVAGAENSWARYMERLFLWEDDHLYLGRVRLLFRGVESEG